MNRLGSNLIMFESKTNVLLYIDKKECYLFDSGNSKELKDEVLNYISSNNLKLKFLINTHSHPDHCQFNNEIKEETFCQICCSEKENLYLNNEELELNMLYGGDSSFLRNNKFLFSKKSESTSLPSVDNLQFIKLSGHCYDMVGILIEDKFLFIGDALFTEKEMRYFPYLYNVEEFIKSLSLLERYQDKTFISSHKGVIDDNISLIKLNMEYIFNIIDLIKKICSKGISYENLFKEFIKYKDLPVNDITYFLYNSTLKSYLNYMINNNIIKYMIKDNEFYLEAVFN